MEQSKFPAKAMMLGETWSDGEALPSIGIEGNMNGPMYKKIFSMKVSGCHLWKGDIWTYDRPAVTPKQHCSEAFEGETGVREILVKEVVVSKLSKPEPP